MINFNGKILPNNQPIFDGENRAFLYGDALFETIRMRDGKIPFLKYHVKRLLHGLHFLKYKIPKKYTLRFFEKEIQRIATGNTRIRITVFRSKGGLYTPKNNRPKFLIVTSPLASSQFELNKKGLTLGVFEEIKLACSPLSNLKTCNSLPFIQAGFYKKEQLLDDCILLNDKNKIAEASSANIFLLKKNKLITPSLSSGCVAGTMRAIILEIAQQEKFQIQEISIPLSSLATVDEIWLTNAIQGIRWVKNINNNSNLPTPIHAPTFIKKLNHF